MTRHSPRMIGAYEVLGELGRGAMGVVYKAKDPQLDRLVALKTMFGSSILEPDANERFLREARSAARLQHANIITIFELGEVGETPYIVMEYLEGSNLAEASLTNQFATLEQRVAVVEQLCAGLAYAHGRGVVHRDVKPSNIFILPNGTVKLLDFGIARLEGGTFATRTGIVLGTPTYMAPEQFTDDEVDHRVDIWSVGIILYELVTGIRPFDGGSVPTLIYRIVHTDVPEISPSEDLPGPLVEVIARALCKDPNDRYSDLNAMASALRAAMQATAAIRVPVEELISTVTQTAPATQPAPATHPVNVDSRHLQTVETKLPHVPVVTVPFATNGLQIPHAGGVGESFASFREGGVFGEVSPLHVIVISPDESVVAVGGVDGSIRIWSLDTRMKVATLRSRMHLRTGHGALTSALCFNLDGSLMASGHLDGSIYIWKTASGLEMETNLRHDGAVNGLDFTPDGQLLISSGMDSTLKLWDFPAVAAGEARRQMKRQPAECTAMAMFPNGASVMTGHANRAIRVHDIATGRMVATLHGHRSAPSAMEISPSGELLASGSRRGSIRLFSIDSKAVIRQFQGHQKNVTSLSFFPNSRNLASVGMEHFVAVWDISVDEPLVTLWGAAGEAFASVAYINKRRWLAVGLSDGRIRLWEN